MYKKYFRLKKEQEQVKIGYYEILEIFLTMKMKITAN